MSPDKGIFCLVMIKISSPPVPGVVAFPTLDGRSLVLVVLAMTGETVVGNFHEAVILVTVDTDGSAMFSGEPVVRLNMVEGDYLPVGGIMTPGTISRRSLVLVILVMAGVTVRRGAFINVSTMAISAGYHHMAPRKGITGLVMVKDQLEPVIDVVALGAVLSGAAGMLIIIPVAGVTVLRGFLERRDGLCPLMAVPARQKRVLPLQWEGGFVMIEIRAVGFDAVVTFQAPCAEGIHVNYIEFCFPVMVTCITGRLLKNVHCHRVTINAGKSKAVIPDLMTHQRETAFFPGEVFLGYQGQRGIRALVLGMAALDATPWLTHRKHTAVQFMWVLQLRHHLSMAVQTTVSHGIRLPRRRMASATTAGQLLV